MDHRIPKVGVALSLVVTIFAAATFVLLNLAFEGPGLTGGLGDDGYVVEARIADTEGIPTKQPVLIRGVEVGTVKRTSYDAATRAARIEFSVDERYAPIRRDAVVAVGERTLLGDSYLRLDPGTEAAGELPSGGAIRSAGSVDFDEALAFLDRAGRGHLESLLAELGEATRRPSSARRLNDTAGELTRLTGQLRVLTDTLRGQEADIAALVSDGAIVLGELGRRERALRAIVASGRRTLDTLAAASESLETGLVELPRLLDVSRRVLAGSGPLLDQAGPLVRDLRRAAPELVPVLDDLPSTTADTVDVVSRLSGIPVLRKTLEVVNLVGPSVPRIEAAARNLVPALAYAAPRARSIGAFFANFASATAHGDRLGNWARFAIVQEPGETFDRPTPAVCEPEDDVAPNAGLCHNAYPAPRDPLDNEPYEPGSYPRLVPFDPPGR